jgi:hypothetical protein
MPGPIQREIVLDKVSINSPHGGNCGLSTDTGVGPAMIGTKKGGPKI